MARGGGTGSGVKTGKSSIFRGVTLFRPTGKWRAQISAAGKTTSLGDFNTEEQAARAFDKALIHKDGNDARINFPLKDYRREFDYLRSLTQNELVAVLRNQARKTGNRSSAYRGVSLLKQTGKWHAQIRFSGRPLHLGYFRSEQEAAEAVDRASIYRAMKEDESLEQISFNFEMERYESEVQYLGKLSEDELLAELQKDCSPKPIWTKEREISSRTPSSRPMSPEGSEDSATISFKIDRHDSSPQPAFHSTRAVTSRGISKRNRLNRRCRLPPVRSAF